MGTEKEDTDPSSPSALRPNSPSGVVAAAARAQAGVAAAASHVPSGVVAAAAHVPSGVVAAAAHAPSGVSASAAYAQPDPSAQPTTDPGLGPASVPPSAYARRAMGVTVPAPSARPTPGPSAITPPELTPIRAPVSATPSPNKDSVELLLEGMAGPRPDRRKTMPQSDGEASAAYHAEHGVRRARPSEPAGPKVVVERPAVAAAPRERPSSPGLAKPGPARGSPGSREALSTFVPARVLRRRVAMAVVAGVLFVLLSFVGLRLSGRYDASAPTAPAEATASPTQTTAPPVAAPSVGTTAEATGSQPVVPTPTTRSFEALHPEDSYPPPAAHVQGGPSATRHPRNPADAPASSGADFGEFKTKF